MDVRQRLATAHSCVDWGVSPWKRDLKDESVVFLRMPREGRDPLHADHMLSITIALEWFIQPIFDLQTGIPIGEELLTRPADGGSPATLWQDAVAHGWAGTLQQALEAAAQKIRKQITGILFINVDPAVPPSPTIRHLSPVVLEITEGREPTPAVWNLVRAHDLPWAVDDWGVGWGDITKLLAWNPMWIKIDRTVITTIQPRSTQGELVEFLVQFATRHGIQLIAEGIETAQERAVLQNLGVPFGQGYFFARPRRVYAAIIPLQGSIPVINS